MKKIHFLLAAATIALAGCQQAGGDGKDAKQAEASTARTAKLGELAPLLKTEGALAGKPFDLDLAEQLRKGPLVLYFFPKVFTSGCTAEAHEFAERSADFAKLGASVIGMSADSPEELAKFSREACRDKFAVARATPEIMEAYDVKMPALEMTNRTSFVIGADGRIAFIHSDLDYKDHVKLAYAAVQKLHDAPRP